MSMKTALTLYELNALVRNVIETSFTHGYWVEAELSECRESRGHCYMELVQKDEQCNTPVARATARCWRSKWMMLRPYFERITGQQLHAGMKVMLEVYPQFHEAYGFSWIVNDINPEFTMGDMARRRKEIIDRLKKEGVFDLQKELVLPMFAQRIAVISSETAAGYGDFCNQLTDNEYGYRFQVTLFPAVMQGEQVEESVIDALNMIYDHIDDYDVVVIIRGGGATADLSGFDTLTLAENVANFPLPVITGIGHDRDESVLDMVSNIRVKTPTAAATFLVDHLADADAIITESQDRIMHAVTRRIEYEKMRLNTLVRQMPMLFSLFKTRQESRLEQSYQRMLISLKAQLVTHQAQIDHLNGLFNRSIWAYSEHRHNQLAQLEARIETVNPLRILKNGYSITFKDGHAVKDASQLKPGDIIETRVEKGKIKSIVK